MYQNYQLMRNYNQQVTPYPINQQNIPYNSNNQNDDRFLGLFAVPFLLGGLTGAALAPAYKRPYPVPYPQPYPVPYPKPYSVYPTYSTNYYYK